MLDELEVWEHIFLEKDDDRLYYLIRMVVTDECAREYVFDKLTELKNKPTEKIEINIDIDKSLKDYPVDLLAQKITKDIISDIKKDIKIIS